VSKLGGDGVRLQMTQLGNVALVIPRVYLDEQVPGSAELALILSRADAGHLARMLDTVARDQA
jgi:hypothetical protein